VFGYYASSICITVILAGFLAILFDPVVVILEKMHLPRSIAAAGIVLAGMSLVGLLGYVLYGKADLCGRTSSVRLEGAATIEPISRKIKTFSKVLETLRTTCMPPRKFRGSVAAIANLA